MTKSTFFRVSALVAMALAAGGCGIFKKGKGPSTPVLGERIAVLTGEGDVAVDPATAALPMSLPQATVNTEWTQSGGNPTKSMGQLALGNALGRAFSIQAGRGNSLTARLGAEPIVAGGRIFTIDTLGAVRAFDAQSGAQVWSSQTPTERGNQASLYGGGLAYDKGRIYATNGLGFVAALDERNGGIVWQVRPGGPLRGAPSVAGDAIYVDEPGQPDLFAQAGRRRDQLVGIGIARSRRRVRLGVTRGRPGHGRRRLLVGRAQRLPLRERAAGLGRHTAAHEHPHQRLLALRRRRRPGDRWRPGVRGRAGRPHGRARPHHRPAPVGAQHRRHLDALGRGRLDFRRHRRCQADLHRAPERQDPLDQPAAAVRARPSRRRARSIIRARSSPATA